MNAIKTTHNLDFEVAEWEYPTKGSEHYLRFRVGTCHGLYAMNIQLGRHGKGLGIVAIDNEVKGNGHLDDVFQWFEYSAHKFKMPFAVLELWNYEFMDHLIRKRGFVKMDEMNVIKTYKMLIEQKKKRLVRKL